MITKHLDEFSGTDTEKIRAAAAFLRKHPHSTLYIAPGVYNITGADEKKLYFDIIEAKHGIAPQLYTLNRDFRYSRLLDLDGACHVRVFAYGALFMLDGFFEPVSIRNCRNVEIRGLTIDWLRKPFSRAKVINSYSEDGANYLRVRFREDMPDTFTCLRTAYCSPQNGVLSYDTFYVREILRESGKNFLLRITNAPTENIVGCDLYVGHFFHSRPAVLVQDSADVVLKDICINSHPGMGITAHLSENITLDGVRIVPSRGDRISTDTDATHFVSCRGRLDIYGCVFEGQGDDAVNVHTYYHAYEPLGSGNFRLRCLAADGTHTAAVDLPRRGDVMCAVRRGTLAQEMCFTVTKSSDNGDGTCTVRLDGGELPDGDEYYLANISACPDLLFADCKVSNNFARGVLIKTKRAEVCGCTFENTHSAAVRVSAEESWGEGISAEDVRIHDNVFINCARQVGPASAVAAFTDSKTCEGEQIGSVRVYNNTVIGSGDVPDFYLKNVREPRIDDNVSAYAAKK